MCVKVKLKKQVLILASMYLPPKRLDYYDCILDDIEKNISVASNVIIMGDQLLQ